MYIRVAMNVIGELYYNFVGQSNFDSSSLIFHWSFGLTMNWTPIYSSSDLSEQHRSPWYSLLIWFTGVMWYLSRVRAQLVVKCCAHDPKKSKRKFVLIVTSPAEIVILSPEQWFITKISHFFVRSCKTSECDGIFWNKYF